MDWNAAAAALSALAAVVAVVVAYWVHRSEQRFAQRQILPDLWGHMSGLNQIDPRRPITPDVLRAANVLELVAVCVEASIVDGRLVRRIFRDGYVTIYERIAQCKSLPGFESNQDGMWVLGQNRAATLLYKQLKREELTRDRD